MGNSGKRLSSAFAGALTGYIEYKRSALNYKATSEERQLAPAFDRFCAESFPGKGAIDAELALAWVADAKGPAGASSRASFARGLARFIVLGGGDAYVIPRKAAPVRRAAPSPHIFTRAELGGLFAAADSLRADPRAGLRHLMAPVAFRLMYCAGLRPYECRTLPVGRFDLADAVIRISDSKGRDRDVPVKRDVADMCAEYSARVEALMPGREAFFPNRDGSGPWSWGAMDRAFGRCLKHAGICGSPGPKPVLYSLRHTFATDCIRRWKEQGVDVDGNLCALQAFMGHERIESTLYYVHLVRGGPGDPTGLESWEPSNRMREEGRDAED